MVQWNRAGPITQRSEDQNRALLFFFYLFHSYEQFLLVISGHQLGRSYFLRQSELYEPELSLTVDMANKQTKAYCNHHYSQNLAKK